MALPLSVVLQWALGNRDRGLIAELDAAIGARTKSSRHGTRCARPLERIIDAIGSEPGATKSDLPDRFGLENELMRGIM